MFTNHTGECQEGGKGVKSGGRSRVLESTSQALVLTRAVPVNITRSPSVDFKNRPNLCI